MKQKISTYIKVFICLLFITLVFPSGLSTIKAQGATKPSIASSREIGTGSIDCEDYIYEKNNFYTLEVYEPVKKATYSFTSSDKAIVTVKTSGTKAYLTGVKAGKATITCQQKLNGKTTKVGTCKVTVKNVKIYGEGYEGLSLGTNKAVYIYYGYRNCDATYTFTSNSKDFTMKEKAEKIDGIYFALQTYTAKKPGTYTVTVKETYNKKTRTVGKAKYEVKASSVAEDKEIYEGDSNWAYYLINYSRGDVKYFFDSDDEGIVDFYLEEDTMYYKGLKPGTVTVKIYEDATGPDESKYIGSCKITVKELKVESIDGYFDYKKAYVGGDKIGFSVSKNPYNAPEEITITSSDTTIATVSELDEYLNGVITPISEGTVTITITCGEFTKTQTITIYADETEYYDHYYDEE
ncbi:MAG: Ig domain protein group 2 domain protein [Herbinix sp.]|jgi:hypothetical protein|nr:Ig domain protein group 2 domain protein [Herbinix sp.]